MLVKLAGDACAFVEAEHAEGAGEFVGDAGGIAEQSGGEGSGDGGGGGAVEHGETIENLRLIALPECGNQLLRGRLGRGLGRRF